MSTATGAELPSVSFGGSWRQPEGKAGGVMIYNSLTRSKVSLVPIDPRGEALTMYVCGPTVYDAAHLGHARTYIQFDVVRRILRDVAGYDVTYVMNVTDVDDKIILRSREKGVTTEALAREWESRFLCDMATLNVERPNAMPRVTEYMDEIVAYVEKIVANGFGYADGKGSVYFDTTAFEKAGYGYAKLVPENVGSAELMAEGEGKLTSTDATLKRDAKDFALWKASKPGEPTWPSPWGEGRPGWHIECSAMIDSTIGFGGAIDIHGGGVDLRFPHHDNELAQSEAFCRCGQTVNYFAHTGHLNIRGLKMAKSLKNFVTIEQALSGEDGARPSTMRLMFCQVKYNSPCDYSEAMLSNARAVEKKFKEFFHNASAALRPLDSDPTLPQKWGDAELELHNAVKSAQSSYRKHLLDDFDTPSALVALQSLVDSTNSYLQRKQQQAVSPVSLVLASSARFVSDSLVVLGIDTLASADQKSMFAYAAGSYASSAANASASTNLAPFLDAIASFRDNVKRAEDSAAILALCDSLRDDVLPDLGVRLEDKATGSVWKFEDPAILKAERARKIADAQAKADKRRADAERREREAAEKRAASLIKPEDMFKQMTDLYSAFDEFGIPSHDAQGEPLSKNGIKSLKKAWDKQKKLYEKAQQQPPQQQEQQQG